MTRAALLAALLLLLPAAARAGDGDGKDAPAAVNAPDGDAKEALERFEREFATEDVDYRLEAVKRLRKVVHPKVADRLLDLALKSPVPAVRREAFKGLGGQAPSAASVGPRVAKFLAGEADANRKARGKGDIGLPLDPKTGDPLTDTPEGIAALRAKRERGALLAEAVRCLHRLDYRARDGVETLEEFLQDGNDDLVAFVLETFGKWKEWTVLDAVLDLFEMYPDEDGWEGGSAKVDTGASGNADANAAKRRYMARYGDPDKRRARPKVTRAILQAIRDITGEECKDPAALRELLRRPDVKRKVKAR